MKNISKLNSGETYTLSQIFSNDFTIAIPDLQRDYCWGLETYDNKGVQQGELVSGFLLSLKNKWHESKDSKGYTPMGLLYGYEWPKGTYQLCDGQQRITTFYLLAGELYRNYLVEDDAKRILHNILTKEVSYDDCSIVVTALQYSIRKTTLYFLSDLVEQYFLGNNCELKFNSLEDREKSHMVLKSHGRPAWYFLEYDNDPTIQSMLGAIYTIRKFLKDSFSDAESITSFAKAISNQVSFIYYDMGNRLRGEETFVVLNTTGEPLTATENLKPVLLGSLNKTAADSDFLKKISRQWEEREDWFWNHKADKELTSDKLSRDFYTWWLLAHGDKKSVDLIKDYRSLPNLRDAIIKIDIFFKSLVRVVNFIAESNDAYSILQKISKWNDETKINGQDGINILQWFRVSAHNEILLPLLLICEKIKDSDIIPFLRRLAKNYYIGQTQNGEDDPEKLRPYLKMREIIELISSCDNVDAVLENPRWYNSDEQHKASVFQGHENKLLMIELDGMVRFDMNVIWKSGATTIERANAMKSRLHLLNQLAQGHLPKDLDEHEATTMSNQYRLLKFLSRWGAHAGKQWQVNWMQWGIWFNSDDYTDNLAKAYKSPQMWAFLSADDLRLTLDEALGKLLFDINKKEEIFSPESGLTHPRGIMRAWLISKYLLSENENILLSDYADYSLCVNKEVIKENLINKKLPMSIGNLCLNYANRNGAQSVKPPFYSDPSCLDSPLFANKINIDYSTFQQGLVSMDDIDATTTYIIDLFNSYLSRYSS